MTCSLTDIVVHLLDKGNKLNILQHCSVQFKHWSGFHLVCRLNSVKREGEEHLQIPFDTFDGVHSYPHRKAVENFLLIGLDNWLKPLLHLFKTKEELSLETSLFNEYQIVWLFPFWWITKIWYWIGMSALFSCFFWK